MIVNYEIKNLLLRCDSKFFFYSEKMYFIFIKWEILNF